MMRCGSAPRFPMNNPLLFAESLLLWTVANYAFGSDPAQDTPPGNSQPRWWWKVSLRGPVFAVALACAGWFSRAGLAASVLLLAGSILVLVFRRLFVPLRHLLEFELLANGIVASLFWEISETARRDEPSFTLFHLSLNQTSCLFIAASLLLYSVRGGSYLVASFLEKAEKFVPANQSSLKAMPTDPYGPMIGYVERIVVVLIVVAGSYEALAFFFAAKGLVRSKELEEQKFSSYFLLGSLASFLVALSAGLILQRTVQLLWK